MDSEKTNLAAIDALLRVRRERIHTAMLLELLVLLVFLAMAFAFVRDSEKNLSTLQDKLAKLENKLVRANNEINRLGVENVILKRSNVLLQRLVDQGKSVLRPRDGYVLISNADLTGVTGRTSEAEGIIKQLIAENAALRAKLHSTGRGGTDLPRCAVAAGSFIVGIDFQGNGNFQVRPMWKATANSAAAQVPGLQELASSHAITSNQFRALAGQVQSWGKRQQTPCGFSVAVYNRHNNIALYKRQYQTVGAYFYPAMR